MKIIDLEFSGFKNVDQNTITKYTFFDHTLISGENFAGKTTICEAICWLFFGCNINGHTIYEKHLLNSKSQRMYVQATFIDNSGNSHFLRREKKETTAIFLDKKQINPNVLLSFTGDKDIFMSSFVLGHFERYSPKEARELLMKILPQVPYEDILSEMPERYSNLLTQSITNKSNQVLKEKRARIKEIEKEQFFLQGQLKALSENVQEASNKENINIKALEQKIADCEKKILELGILQNSASLDNLEAEKQLLRKQYDTLKEKLADANLKAGDTCPRCLQEITLKSEYTIKSMASEKNKEIQKEMSGLIERGNEVKKQLESLSSAKGNAAAIDFKLNSIKSELEGYRDAYQKALEAQARDNIAAKSKHTIAEINKRLAILNEEHSDLEDLSEAITIYNSIRSEQQFKSLSSLLCKVSIRLERLVKSTGELKECFEILYEDKDYMLLSNSEKIRTALEISNLINKETGLNLPVFMDNAESITHYEKPERQIFEAVVKRGEQLSVSEIIIKKSNE